MSPQQTYQWRGPQHEVPSHYYESIPEIGGGVPIMLPKRPTPPPPPPKARDWRTVGETWQDLFDPLHWFHEHDEGTIGKAWQDAYRGEAGYLVLGLLVGWGISLLPIKTIFNVKMLVGAALVAPVISVVFPELSESSGFRLGLAILPAYRLWLYDPWENIKKAIEEAAGPGLFDPHHDPYGFW